MNRAERRMRMKKIPGYKKLVKSMTKNAMNDLETAFKQKWDAGDETLNEGARDYNYGENDCDEFNC